MPTLFHRWPRLSACCALSAALLLLGACGGGGGGGGDSGGGAAPVSSSVSSRASSVSSSTSSRASSSASSIQAARSRPRIFMALHGSNQLANDASLDNQWSSVRQNLDGMWGNNAGVDTDTEARLFRKVSTRTLISEWPLTATQNGPEVFAGAQKKYPDLVINREAIAFYTDQPSDWVGRTISSLEAKYVNDPAVAEAYRFKAVYTGWQPYNFEPAISGEAANAFNAAKGAFVECPRAACTGSDANRNKVGFIAAIRAMHAQGKPFIWFASNGGNADPGWLASTQRQYKMVADLGLWQANDVIMIINYHGSYPLVPETVNGQAADTSTGILYWLLQQ